jgi:nicotinamidase-related amidase
VGASSHQCVLFTAMDAHVRGFSLYVPRDCMAAPTSKDTAHALFILENGIGAHTPLGSSIRFKRLHKSRRSGRREPR